MQEPECEIKKKVYNFMEQHKGIKYMSEEQQDYFIKFLIQSEPTIKIHEELYKWVYREIGAYDAKTKLLSLLMFKEVKELSKS